MKITADLEAELTLWLDTFWTTYLRGDLDTWATFIKDDYYNIGGTKEEIWHSKQEILDYTYSILDQIVGAAEFTNRRIEVQAFGDHIMVNEFVDINVKIDGEWSFYGPFRISTFMEKIPTGWIIQHQHGSYPDMKALEGEAFAEDALRAENLRLQEAVDQRTAELVTKNKELEIESALERVRAVAMGMKNPDDMFQVCRVISDELSQFGIQGIRNIQTVIIQEKRMNYDCYQFFPAYQREILEHTEYLKNPVEGALVNRMLEAKDGYFEGILTGQELEEFRTHRKEEKHLADPLMDGVDEIFYFFYSIGPGALGITLYQELSPAGLLIFKRFHQIFSLAYSRFRDIEKAEAQATEAKIEAALERVRSKAMAMHSSEDLALTADTFFSELYSLDVTPHRCGIGIINKESRVVDIHVTTRTHEGETKKMTGELTLQGHFVLDDIFKNWVEQKEYRPVLRGKEIFNYYKAMNPEVIFPDFSTDAVQYGYYFFFTEGGVFAWTDNELEERDLEIFRRYNSVLSLTYRRFIELQKAEAQAREAQIEVALEKIRSRSLAMHQSDELLDASDVMFAELEKLNINALRIGICTINGKTGESEIWSRSENKEKKENQIIGVVPKGVHPIFDNMVKAWRAKEPFYISTRTGAEVEEYYQALVPYLPYPLPKKFNKAETLSAFFFREGSLNLISLEPLSEDERAILSRFAKGFGQIYQRFLDLQKAEAQAREAQIEAALERVRSRSLAMHHPDELQEVVRVIAEELKQTGVILDTWGAVICTYFQDSKDVLHWTAAEDPANPSTAFLLPYFNDELYDEAWESKNRGDSYFAKVFSFEVKNAFFNHAFENSDYRQLPDDYKQLILQSESHGIAWAWAKNSAIMIPSIQGVLPSEEEQEILIRFAKVFEQAFIRFLDLQKAEAQTRESEIELALERVRARTMAMQHSDELAEASLVLDQQVRALGIRTRGCAFHIYGEDDSTEWFSSEHGMMPVYHTPRENVFLEYYEAGQQGESLYIKEFEGEACATHYDYLCTLPVMGEALKELKASGGSFPERQIDHVTFFKYGYLLFITLDEVPDSHNIFKRFAKVFEQTYTRFLDLQKAEAQAREAKIEAGLEKVRASTMAMHDSKDLSTTIADLFSQLRALNLRTIRCGIAIFNDSSGRINAWTASEGDEDNPIKRTGNELLTGHPLLEGIFEAWQNQEEYSYELKGDDLKNYYDVIGKSNFPVTRPNENSDHLAQYYLCVMFPAGGLFALKDSPFTEAEKMLMRRFSDVFHLTFIRHLDLMKAEAQAREAKIEASLERLRAQSMAMHQSEDLILSTSILFEELEKLDLSIERSGIGVFDPKTKDCELWTCVISSEGKVELVRGVTSLTIHPMLVKTFDAWLEKKPFSYVLEGQELLDYYGIVSTSDFHLSKEAIETSASLPKEYYSYTPFVAGGLYFFSANAPKESDIEIVRRFAKVFDQTYTRFLDLQKAEAQIRDEKIKNAMERVRSRSLAMHKSAELRDVIQTVSEQFKELEIDISGGAFIVINQDLEKGFYCWGAGGVGNYVRKVKIPFIERPIYQRLADGIKNGDQFFTEYYGVEEKRVFFKHLFQYDPFNATPSSRQELLLSIESDYARSCVVSKNTSIFIINHDGKQFSDEENEFLRQIGRVFEQAYIRFIDLEKAEKQARLISEERDRLEITLNELKATQAQLIQQEKLASLGQLTAGIAHEIKNPLNFVNNFSDLSRELIEEVFEELANLETSDTKEEIIAILTDVKNNLTKVHEHGTRADSIVTSMLQHSRASGSKREPKAFNPLVKEFVNLSFHGMRAGKAPINVDIDLQLDPQVGDVTLISEDFSRVILNLCNNGFDAMREKTLSPIPSPSGRGVPEGRGEVKYLPKLTVTTALQKDKVILSIADNGRGIPKEIQDKILQPFFTTKKGTEGTGLGLSITHDIVKAHGGELSVQSNLGEGATFRIQLPTQI